MNFTLIKREIEQGETTLAERVESMIAFIGQQEDAATLKGLQAQSDAILAYLAQQDSIEDYNAAMLVTARIRHRLGELLAATVRRGRPEKNNRADGIIPTALGDTQAKRQNTSQRSQQIAAVPWEKIAARINQQTEKHEKARLGRIVRECRKIEKELTRKEAAAQIIAGPPPLPEGPFRVVAVDPPWKYDSRPDDPTHRAANPYPSMTLDEIRALPVGGMAHEDAVLWLWTTNAHLWHVPEILAAWGFTYKTMLTWAKDRMGTGDWLRGQTEHCVMAVRGKPAVLLTNQTTLIQGPMREHSRKPDEFYALVESLCPAPPLGRCELFARCEREGWTSHGNQQTLFS